MIFKHFLWCFSIWFIQHILRRLKHLLSADKLTSLRATTLSYGYCFGNALAHESQELWQWCLWLTSSSGLGKVLFCYPTKDTDITVMQAVGIGKHYMFVFAVCGFCRSPAVLQIEERISQSHHLQLSVNDWFFPFSFHRLSQSLCNDFQFWEWANPNLTIGSISIGEHMMQDTMLRYDADSVARLSCRIYAGYML